MPAFVDHRALALACDLCCLICFGGLWVKVFVFVTRVFCFLVSVSFLDFQRLACSAGMFFMSDYFCWRLEEEE